MLYKLYETEVKVLNKKVITEENEIKDEFLNALKALFINYQDYSNPKQMIEDTALRLANNVVFSAGKASVYGKTFHSKKELANYFYDDLVRSLTDINPLWEAYSKIDFLLEDMASFLTRRYVISRKEVNDFDDAIKTTITRYKINGQRIKSKEDLEKCISFILNEYFNKDNMAAFTNNRGARRYVASKSKEEILKEMTKTVGLDGFEEISEKLIRNVYAKSFSYPYLLEKQSDEKTKKSI